MGRRIFVTYGNVNYYNSLKRIEQEAIMSGEFDVVKIYTDSDLPPEIKNHPLLKYKRGGGYWLWKPFVCLDAMKDCGDDDVLVYSDCGNKIFKHKEWSKYWNWSEKHSAVFFYYGAIMEERTRSNLLNAFNSQIPFLKDLYQLQSGFFIYKKTSYALIQSWLNCMVSHPEFVIDVDPNQKSLESKKFIEHRHDQAVLSCLVYSYRKNYNLFITRQRSERLHRGGQAVYNARISDEKTRSNSKLESIPNLLIRMLLIVPFREFRMKLLFLLQ